MIRTRLRREVDRVASRDRKLRLRAWLSAIWLLGAAIGLGLFLLKAIGAWSSPWSIPTLVVSVAILALAAIWITALSQEDRVNTARAIEEEFPDLDSRLITAVEQRSHRRGPALGFLQESVLREVLEHARTHPWGNVIPNRRLILAMAGHLMSLLLFALVIRFVADAKPPIEPLASMEESGTLAQKDDEEPIAYKVSIEPGDTEVERGSSLLVLARFEGELPRKAFLVPKGLDERSQPIEMSQSLDDPLFGCRIAEVSRDFSYQVEFEGRKTETFVVRVYEHPELIRLDVELVYPEYTGKEAMKIEDTRRISAVEGTRATLSFHLNKAVESGQISCDAEDLELGRPRVVVSGETVRYTLELVLETSKRYRLDLIDEAGRQNKNPVEIIIEVHPNRPPHLKLVRPARDLRVSPIEELSLEATISDDYGLEEFGMSYNLAGSEPKNVSLGGDESAAPRRVQVDRLIYFEEMNARPDQLVSYYFWADDRGADGQKRRAYSDMYFAEVRHFEEIFRQGQQAPGGESQNQRKKEPSQSQQGQAQQAEKLAELQKQIINATWKLIRRELATQLSDGFTPDSELLRDSQASALEQVDELATKVRDKASRQHASEVEKHMQQALVELNHASAEDALVGAERLEALRSALPFEQSAYQSLLRLRAREHAVVRSQQGQQSSSSSSSKSSNRSQQQLQQLKLDSDANRYEAQKTARSGQKEQADREARETRQVLNRLRELARRQGDLNKRLQELQAALEAADTAEEKKEVRRQLKRLRDEEQKILRDLDDLNQRMDSPENRERMADAKKQLEESRRKVREASEALETGQVSRATSAGTRAERRLEELREEFRRRASGRFEEEMREMRREARSLDETERSLAERIRALDADRPRTLRSGGERNEIEKGLEGQGQKLDKLLEQMRETVQEAETSEPLLSRKLYDSVRDARQKNIETAIDNTRKLLDQGLLTESSQEERRASEGIRQLREGVEDAAESILGDGSESLRRAREELDVLAEDLDQEIARAEGHQARPRKEEGAGSDRSPGGQRPGQGPRRLRNGSGNPQEGRGSSAPQAGESPESFLVERGSRRQNPFTGEGFRKWSDRLRDVEELLEDPDLRAEAARIRDRARGVRSEFKKDFKKPDWDLVKTKIYEPLEELKRRIDEEISRTEDGESRVPIDRDPVPEKFSRPVERYRERIGSGK